MSGIIVFFFFFVFSKNGEYEDIDFKRSQS